MPPSFAGEAIRRTLSFGPSSTSTSKSPRSYAETPSPASWTISAQPQLVELLADWPLTVVSVAPLLVEAWQLRHNLTVHDALYVVATRRIDGATLVSTDRRLPNAPGVDVPVITPDQLPS